MAEELSLAEAVLGLLALAAAEREERLAVREKADVEPRRTEVILADVGLTPAQIGLLLNKKPNSVTKTISRSRAKER